MVRGPKQKRRAALRDDGIERAPVEVGSLSETPRSPGDWGLGGRIPMNQTMLVVGGKS